MFYDMIHDYVDLGGKYMLEVEASELIYDKDNNKVTGVKAVGYDGTQYTINAKEVIMGTGGFSNNAKLQEQYLSNKNYPLQGAWQMYGMTQNDGKVFESALNIGAGTFQTWKSDPYYYTIWSDDFFKDVEANGLPVSFNDDLTCQGDIDAGKAIPETYELIDLCVEKGIAIKADTLEDLANQLGMDAHVLSETVAKYNQAVESGVDEEFGKDASNLTVSICQEGPYYAFKGASYIYSTVGGLDVNTNMQVLSSDNETPIKGLYAVGTVS